MAGRILSAGRQNWRTTLSGTLGLIVVVATHVGYLVDDIPETVPDWNVVVTSVVFFVGLFMAQDGDA